MSSQPALVAVPLTDNPEPDLVAPVDLDRFDNDALYALVLLHRLQIERYDPANAAWYEADIERISLELARRSNLL